MIEFELRDAIRNSVTTTDTTATFNMTIVVGVVGNTYPAFLNSNNSINVICNKSLTGDAMELQVNQACVNYVAQNFPPIN